MPKLKSSRFIHKRLSWEVGVFPWLLYIYGTLISDISYPRIPCACLCACQFRCDKTYLIYKSVNIYLRFIWRTLIVSRIHRGVTITYDQLIIFVPCWFARIHDCMHGHFKPRLSAVIKLPNYTARITQPNWKYPASNFVQRDLNWAFAWACESLLCVCKTKTNKNVWQQGDFCFSILKWKLSLLRNILVCLLTLEI